MQDVENNEIRIGDRVIVPCEVVGLVGGSILMLRPINTPVDSFWSFSCPSELVLRRDAVAEPPVVSEEPL